MNQEVIYSILLSPVKTQAEKEKRKEGGRCYTYILTPGSLFEVVSKVGFFLKQALVENEPLYLGVSHIILMASP